MIQNKNDNLNKVRKRLSSSLSERVSRTDILSCRVEMLSFYEMRHAKFHNRIFDDCRKKTGFKDIIFSRAVAKYE